ECTHRPFQGSPVRYALPLRGSLSGLELFLFHQHLFHLVGSHPGREGAQEPSGKHGTPFWIPDEAVDLSADLLGHSKFQLATPVLDFLLNLRQAVPASLLIAPDNIEQFLIVNTIE